MSESHCTHGIDRIDKIPRYVRNQHYGNLLYLIFNNNFGSATNLCLRYARAKCGRKFHILGYYFCNLGTPRQIFQILSQRGKLTPHVLPPCDYDHPNNVPGGQKSVTDKKHPGKNCSNSFQAHSFSTFVLFNLFFFWRLQVPTRRYDLLVPEAGGGGIQTRYHDMCEISLDFL